MRRAGRGREDELVRVYRAHVDSVFRFLVAEVDRDVAEDLTAVTFERVIRAWDRYDAALAGERTWIMAIARNALVDHYRRARSRETRSLDDAAEVEAPDRKPLERRMAVDELKRMLGALSPRAREIVALRYGADLAPEEIARMTGLSVANVNQILSRSLRRIRAREEARPAGAAQPQRVTRLRTSPSE